MSKKKPSKKRGKKTEKRIAILEEDIKCVLSFLSLSTIHSDTELLLKVYHDLFGAEKKLKTR